MPRGYLRYFLAVAIPAIVVPAVLADQSGKATLAPHTYLNLDSGAVSGTTGDVLWNGTALVPQGRARLFNLGNRGPRAFKFISARHASSAQYSAVPIPAGALTPGDIFGVRTSAGNYAKVIVTAASGASLWLEYKTFLARPNATASTPVITQLQNNYSYLLPGVPNYGIAPGSLFVIIGTGLSSSAPPVLQSSAAPGLPTTLNQTSISVTVNGVVTTPALYYTSTSQLAAVLPSTTPAGKGAITVTYNGTASAAAPIEVVASALGLDTLYGTGNGAGVATDSNGNVFGPQSSAMPGQEIILWGSGVGADTSNDDRTFPQKQDNLTNIPMQVYIGGMPATVLYRGRSQYPGVDQINVTIPAVVPAGCYVSVVAQSGSVVSNAVTIPVNPGGGPCSDAGLGLNGTQLGALASSGKTRIKTAFVGVGQFVSQDGNESSLALAGLTTLLPSAFGAGYAYASSGSCTMTPLGFSFAELGVTGAASALDAGAIQVSGPGGVQALEAQGAGGLYAASFSAPAITPGTYTISTTGGKDLAAFNVAIEMPAPFTVANQAALTSINRSQGVTVSWNLGFPNGIALVTGLSPSPEGSVSFACWGPSATGQLSIPASILLALPAGPGKISIGNFTSPQTVPGADFSYAGGLVNFSMGTTFK